MQVPELHSMSFSSTDRSSTRKLEWPENADCRDWGSVKVGVGRRRLEYPAGGARRPGNIMLGAGRSE